MPLKWFFFINFIRILWFIWDLVLVLFNSHKDITSGKILAFGNILGFPGINWAQKWTKTLRPVSPETLNFERLFKFYFCLVRDYLRSKFHQTCAIFRGERAQNPPPPSPPPPNPKRRVVSWMLHRHENIWTFITWQSQMLKLMKLITSM